MPRPRHRLQTAAVALAALLAVATPAAVPEIVERDLLSLEVVPLDVRVLEPADGLPPLRVGDGVATLAATLAWPGDDARSRLTVEAEVRPDAAGGRRLELRASLRLPDGRTVRTGRTVAVEDGRTTLVEVHRVGRRPLTLAIALGVERVPTVAPPPSPGRAVRLRLEVQRVDGGRVETLETNLLQAFVGRPVRYAFRLGGVDGTGHAVRVRLRPLEIRGALATILVELEGSLPGPGGAPSMIARTETLVVSRGASSTLAVEAGAPPSGYRFVVTPGF